MPDELSSDDNQHFVPTGQRGYDANDNQDIEVSAEDLAALKDEVEVLHGGDMKQAADTLLREKVSGAIISISKLATGASTERVRLDASKYIVERVLGPVSKIDHVRDLDNDPIYQFMQQVGMVPNTNA